MAIKKKREDLFFGVHFDFHAGPNDTIGTIVDEEGIAQMLDAVKPDFVQIDTKGHEGISSYNTKFGTPAKDFKCDTLSMWRRLTKERGIALYGHHSGVYDRSVARKHPEWAIVMENGDVSEDYVSVFSPYAQKVLIPQIIELATEYELDGAWIDGECWGSYTDYSTYATERWKNTTNRDVPKRGDEGFKDYRNFCREGFKEYVRNYISAVKEVCPEFQITSNWMFSHYMPEKNNVPIDYISGDYACFDAVNSARCIGRCIASREVTWDLMAWGQNAVPLSWKTRNRTTKSTVQYCQEASMILALGGAFQFFNILYGTGGMVQRWAIPTWKKTAEFCRERQQICWKSKLVEQIAVVYPEGYDENSQCLYSAKYKKDLFGWIRALQDIQISTQVLQEYQCIRDILQRYPVVLLPSSMEYKEETIKALNEYVTSGGKLIAECDAIKFFGENSETENKLIWLDGGDCLAAMETNCTAIGETEGIYYYDNNYYDDNDCHTAAAVSRCGKGTLVKLGLEIGRVYKENSSPAVKKFIKNTLKLIEFEPIVKISGSGYVDVTIAQKEGALLINLINMLGAHDEFGVRSFDEIPPLYNIEVEIKCDNMPVSVMIEPEHIQPEYDFKESRLKVKVEKLEIHSVIVLK